MSKKVQLNEAVTVESEDHAIYLLQKALYREFENTLIDLNFEDWPILRLEYKGEKFQGTITPDIAKALVDLQEVMNRVYMQAVHGTTSLIGLEQNDKRKLELVATVEEGSSLIDINLGDYAEKLATDLVGKMSSTEIIITVIGVSIVLTAGWVWKSHLKNRSETRQKELDNESRLQLSLQETERLRIVTEAMAHAPIVKKADVLAEEPRNSFVKSAIEADTLTIQETATITGGDAKRLHRSPRSSSQDVQLNGTYFIEGFQWAPDGETARVRVRKKDDGTEFLANISVNALTVEQKRRFKDRTFDRSEVYLSINGTVLHDSVTTAKIVSVTDQPSGNQIV